MFSITADKKNLVNALQVLIKVSSVKSSGAIPNENTRIDVTPTSMTLSASSMANHAIAKDIPIEIEGDIGDYNESPLMINTKKFLASVKAISGSVTLSFKEGRVKIGKGNKAFVLDGFSVSTTDIPECTFYDYKISTKELEKTLKEISSILKIPSRWNEDGAFFMGSETIGPSDGGFIWLKNSGLFKILEEPVFIHPDFFMACLGKVEEEEATPGLSVDKTKVVLSVGNFLLYKSIKESSFPSHLIDKIREGTEQKESNNRTITCNTNISDVLNGIKESHGIIEADIYTITVKREGIEISAANSLAGAKGKVFIKGENILPDDISEISGDYSYQYLSIIPQIFDSTKEVPLRMEVQEDRLNSLYIKDSEKMYYFKGMGRPQ